MIQKLLVLLVFIAEFVSLGAGAQEYKSDPQFLAKLNVMLERTDKSIKVLREQITENQSAPFLADLYMNLGDLLSQKANVLYYIQMEREHSSDLTSKMAKKFSPIVTTTEEAINIYKLLLKEFPKFDKRDKVMYRLALSLKSIDEAAAFEDISAKLIKEYPDTKEAMSVRLLMGQHHFDKQDYSKAIAAVTPVLSTPFAYERNMARYRIGLCYHAMEKFKDALDYFEKVATDEKFKEEDVPLEVSLKEKRVKSNVKREALIDSVRAYTEVYKGENADPVGYYNRVAPTEVLFQEVMEKLAFRYIFLKKYNFAVKLLRTLSERLADPQKVMNIYQEVLVMIPLVQRVNIPFQEMQFVLEKFNHWASYYNLAAEQYKVSYNFFEKQIRELGTKAHDLAKNEYDAKRKANLLVRARDFYLVYLGFFDKSPLAVKVAINLGDVFYLQRQYLKSGTYYFRTFLGDFGPPSNRPELIRNAILAFQKKAEYSFYEQLRVKGMLVKAVKTYMKFDSRKANDPELHFALAKTMYEQGFYNKALDALYNFMKRFPNSKDVQSAGELIFEYHNIRSDFPGLAKWSDKILKLNLPNKSFTAHVKEIRSKALLKKLDEDVKTRQGYDAFNQGKSYLQSALSADDEAVRTVALEQALARSKAEKDIETFLRAALLLAKKEKDQNKRGSIIMSMADETLAVTKYYQTFSIWKRIYQDNTLTLQSRTSALEKSIKLALMLKDFEAIRLYLNHPLWSKINDSVKRSVKQAILELLDSPVRVDGNLVSTVNPGSSSDEELLTMFKAQYKVPSNVRARILMAVKQRCSDGGGKPVCRWLGINDMVAVSQRYVHGLNAVPTGLDHVEKQAATFNGLLAGFKTLEGSGDPHLDIVLSLRKSTVFEAFGQYLHRVAQANPPAAQILEAKSRESLKNAANWKAQCGKIISSTSILTPANKYCKAGQAPSLEQALKWTKLVGLPSGSRDVVSKGIVDLQKKIFVDRRDVSSYMELTEKYYKNGRLAHAAAAALNGVTKYSERRDDFSTLLGCTVARMGLFSEAAYHLRNGSNFDGYKSKCQAEIRARAGEF